jgi:hypothetical protein
MCGIVGIYNLRNAIEIASRILVGQENRGTDSTGLAYIKRRKIIIQKKAIPPSEFYKIVKREYTKFLIGHNRNATTNISEKDQDKEAHPFISENKEFAIVHNGHITNYEKIKSILELFSHKFESGVDSEVLVHLLEELLSKFERDEAIYRFFKFVDGENILVLFKDKELYGFPGNTFFKVLILPETESIIIASSLEGLYEFVNYTKINKIYYLSPKYSYNNQMIKITLKGNKTKVTLWGDWNKNILKDNTFIARKEIMCDFCRTSSVLCEKIEINGKTYDRCYNCYKENKLEPKSYSYSISKKKDDSVSIEDLSEIYGKCELCNMITTLDKLTLCHECKSILCGQCYYDVLYHKCKQPIVIGGD